MELPPPPPPSKPSLVSKFKNKFHRTKHEQDQLPLEAEFQRTDSPRPEDTSLRDVSFASQTVQEGGAKSLNLTARRIYAAAATAAATYLSPDPAPPRTVNQYGEPMAILNQQPKKSVCRFSMFLNLVLILALITGIVLAACGSLNETAAVIGPCFIVLSIFALCGKGFLTLFFNDDPLPLFSKFTNKIDEKLNKSMVHTTSTKSTTAPLPWTFPPQDSAKPEAQDVSFDHNGHDFMQYDYNSEPGGQNIAMNTMREQHGSGNSTPTLKYSDDQI